MRVSRIAALFCAASAATLLFGCSSQSSFTKEEINQIKNKPTGGIPEYGQKAIADKAAEGQRLYQESLKKRGIENAPMPPGGVVPGPPPGATQGPPPGVAGGPPK